MKRLSQKTFDQIRSWVYRHGRHLEVVKWRYFFEGGDRDSVVEALSFYRNEDGGFGHGLEPDNTNPHSSPATTGMAYRILRSIGCAEREHSMVQGILQYLEHCEHFTDRGWYWSIPSNNDYPCQPWYRFPNAPWFPPDWPPENYTNSLLFGLVLEYLDTSHPLCAKTLKAMEYRLGIMDNYREFCRFAKSSIEQSIEADDRLSLIELALRHGLRSSDECEALMSRFLAVVQASAREDVCEQVRRRVEGKGADEEELDSIVDGLGRDRIWSEGGLLERTSEEKKAEVFHISALWWPIISAIDDMVKLKEHDRLPLP